jgi:hypothetical protein
VNQVCEGCGEPLTGPGRADRRFHGGPCRKRAWKRRQLEQQAPELRTAESANAEPAPSLDREALLEEAVSEPRLLVYVARAAQTNWRAAAWILERRYPTRWGHGEREPELSPDPFAQVDELAARRRLHPTR